MFAFDDAATRLELATGRVHPIDGQRVYRKRLTMNNARCETVNAPRML
jgi:hypothetical protein